MAETRKSVLVTGANGQLGREIRKLAHEQNTLDFTFTDLEELDITDEREVNNFFQNSTHDFCINTAAYTAVDKAETEYEEAVLVNGTAPGILARQCRQHDIIMIHISTDFVFDGQADKPYREEDPVNPLSSYGRSKLEGEKAVMENCDKSYVIRTSWLYSAEGHNFVQTMIRLGRSREEIKVVNDQTGSPTWAADLADTLVRLMLHPEVNQRFGLYHYANRGETTWYEFACEIMDLADLRCKVIPVRTKAYPTPARRPRYSVLDTIKIRKTFDLEIPHWRDSLREMMREWKD